MGKHQVQGINVPTRQAKHTPAITVNGCMAVIRELAQTGDQPNSLKLALWAAALSPRKYLAPNGKQARVLAPLVRTGLPEDRAELKRWLTQGTGAGVFDTHIAALYTIERMDREGKLPECPQDSWSVEQWDAWRDALALPTSPSKVPGIGLKVASFAGLLLCPLTCPLVPVDQWVMTRLGYTYDAPRNETEYRNIERTIADERARNGRADMPLGAWHWFKWSEIRQAAGAEPLAERPESHANLSPRAY